MAALPQVHRGGEVRDGGAAVLVDPAHGQEQGRGVQLGERIGESPGDGRRASGGVGGGGAVIVLLPRQQEGLHGGLGGRLLREAVQEPGHHDPNRHQDHDHPDPAGADRQPLGRPLLVRRRRPGRHRTLARGQGTPPGPRQDPDGPGAAGVTAPVTGVEGHGPPHRRRRRARSTSLAASRLARS